MRKLNILHVSESYGWSGGAAQCLALASALRLKGHRGTIACPEGGDLWNRAVKEGFETFHFRPERDYDFRWAFRIAKIISSVEADIVHAHHPKAHTMCLLGKILSSRRPVLVVSRRVSHKIRGGFFAGLKYRNKAIDGFAAVAASVKEILADYGVPRSKIRVIYSGTDEKTFSPRRPSGKILDELNISPSDLPVGLVGNFSADKGQDILVEAARSLLEEYPGLLLVFAGRDTDSPGMRKMLSEKKYPPERARLLGLRADVPEILSVLKISVNCAVKGEALSGSVRESMAMGIPVIASDISGNGEIVIDGKTGFLYPPGDSKALAGLISSLLKDPGGAAKTAAEGMRLVREKFTVSRMAENTLDFYLNLLKFKL